MSNLGTMGGTGSTATSVSTNGTIVAGQSYTATGTKYQAFVWTAGTGMTSLGSLGEAKAMQLAFQGTDPL